MALIAAHLNAGQSGGDSVAIGIYSPFSPTSIPPSPPFSLSLISLMVSVDFKHHVYLLTYYLDDSALLSLLSLQKSVDSVLWLRSSQLWNIKMALIAAHLNTEVIPVVTV